MKTWQERSYKDKTAGEGVKIYILMMSAKERFFNYHDMYTTRDPLLLCLEVHPVCKVYFFLIID